MYIVNVHDHRRECKIKTDWKLKIFNNTHTHKTKTRRKFWPYPAQQSHTHITTSLLLLHPFNGPFSGTTQVSQYQKGKTNLDFTEARHSEWQWHQLGHMQDCTSVQTDNHTSTPPLSFLQAGCPSCRPTNSVKALKAVVINHTVNRILWTSWSLVINHTVTHTAQTSHYQHTRSH